MKSLSCWRCGAALAKLTLPLSRLDECPSCSMPLHVCRMCVHYDPAVARQCREVLDVLGGGDVLELGAGSGALAADLLSALVANGGFSGRYLILEPSPELRARQRASRASRGWQSLRRSADHR